jgi:ammonium transporter, Amt family
VAVVGDELTGLPGARAFGEALERQAALARRYDRPGALILLASARADGPGCRAVARALRERLRATDLVARTSGCEFAVLLPEARAAEARELAGELVGLASRAAGLPAAAGIACFPDGLDRPAGALLADAEAALAGARGSVPPVAMYDACAPRPRSGEGSPAERLRRALDDSALVLDHRPVVDVHSGAVDHRAVVARLPGADGGLLERAERFGLAHEIDRRAVEHALASGPERLVVPLADGAAANRRFADWLVEAFAARAGAGARVMLAVPEPAALVDLVSVRALAARVGEYGARLALDQFGRFGAFALLKALPVHQVRLDPALVRGLPVSDRDRAVVLALVQAAEALGAEPVATGVDGAAELTAVRGFGIRLAEGALFAASGEN